VLVFFDHPANERPERLEWKKRESKALGHLAILPVSSKVEDGEPNSVVAPQFGYAQFSINRLSWDRASGNVNFNREIGRGMDIRINILHAPDSWGVLKVIALVRPQSRVTIL